MSGITRRNILKRREERRGDALIFVSAVSGDVGVVPEKKKTEKRSFTEGEIFKMIFEREMREIDEKEKEERNDRF